MEAGHPRFNISQPINYARQVKQRVGVMSCSSKSAVNGHSYSKGPCIYHGGWAEEWAIDDVYMAVFSWLPTSLNHACVVCCLLSLLCCVVQGMIHSFIHSSKEE